MNKPQDPGKTIHSNNYLSLFVKKESFNNGKMNDKTIERYFKALKNPQDKYKGKDLQMYNFVNDNISEINQERLLHNKQWLKDYHYLHLCIHCSYQYLLDLTNNQKTVFVIRHLLKKPYMEFYAFWFYFLKKASLHLTANYNWVTHKLYHHHKHYNHYN